MMFYGYKPSTKDIDIIFLDNENLKQFVKAATIAGIQTIHEHHEEYRDLGTTTIMVAESGIQLDLFNKTVFNALTVKETIVKRAIHYNDIEKLHIYLLSPEDIVLFKGITEREADFEDIRILLESGINWTIVEEECLSQKDSGMLANRLLDKVSDLETRYTIKVKIDKIKEHADKYVLRESFKLFLKDSEMSFKELYEIIKEKTGYSETWTRNRLKELEKDGFITSSKKGRRRLYKLKT
jgi:DNA-binding transcriptional ArsR family regulator